MKPAVCCLVAVFISFRILLPWKLFPCPPLIFPFSSLGSGDQEETVDRRAQEVGWNLPERLSNSYERAKIKEETRRLPAHREFGSAGQERRKNLGQTSNRCSFLIWPKVLSSHLSSLFSPSRARKEREERRKKRSLMMESNVKVSPIITFHR